MLKLLGWAALALIGGFVALTLLLVQQRASQARVDFPPEGHFVDVDGHPVHYVMRGSGPDLVLLHGANGTTRDWTFAMADRLAQRYRVLIFDRPGLGYTPPLVRNMSVVDQARLLQGAAEALGVTRPVVVGQSFGGAVTMAWAVHHPNNIAAAVSIAGATYPWEGGQGTLLYNVLALPVLGPALGHLIAAYAPAGYVAERVRSVFEPDPAPEGYAAYIGIPVVLKPVNQVSNARQRMSLKAELEELHVNYPDVTIPIEIVHGDADTTVGLTVHSIRLRDDAPNAALTVLNGAGHMPHHTHADTVVAAIDRAAERAGLR
ncbi:MAG: alpha/beta hydrolase [Pseudomonadota bacterium]